MKKLISLSLIHLLFVLVFVDAEASDDLGETYTTWKAGVAGIVITPDESMWMAGYGSRNHPSEGTVNDLWVKALALQDMNGNECVLVTMDLEEIPKIFSDWIKNQLKIKFQLSEARIILNVSHTHSSPVLEDFGDIY